MATFTIDLLTGNVYLFSGDFSGSGSTPTTGSTYPQVSNYSALPAAGSHTGQIYVARDAFGTYVLNKKPAGLYFSTGSIWRYLGELPKDLLNSTNFQILDGVDSSKGIVFNTSAISGGTFRTLTIQDKSGTIAYLTDLATKVDLSVFNGYTGATQTLINTKLDKTIFTTFTGTTLPANYYNKTQINAYTGATLLLINAKQNTLIAGQGIKIAGSTISVTGGSYNTKLQLLDTVGGVQVNNVAAIPITWTQQVFSGTSLSFTGGTRIYVKANGVYDISYVLNVNNDTGSAKNIGTVVRKNGNTDITPMSSASQQINAANDSSTNIMPEYLVALSNGDYVELMAFRIGTSGAVYTMQNTSWIKMKKL